MSTTEHGVSSPAVMTNQQRIREAIKQMILDRDLQPGDPLPTEAELMELLDASRNPIREAIKALQALGYVEVRHGHGTYVGSLPLTPLQDFLIFRLRRAIPGSVHEAAELLQVREALEVGMASDVVRTLHRNGTDELASIVAAMKAKAEAGRFFPQEDRRFHAALYETLGNTLVTELQDVFWASFHAVDPQLPGPHYTPMEAWGWHQRLLDAINNADVDEYRVRMRDHFDGIRVRISHADEAPGS